MIFQCGFLPLIQRATRVTRTSATAIDHIITDAIFDKTMHSGIIKTQISDHFPIFTILENCKNCKNNEKTKITKRDFNEENIQNFHFLLENINWDQFLPSNAPNEAYNNFLKIFSDLYDVTFPKKEIEVKSKYLNTPWITIGLRKSSKRKQRLYEKFLKKRTLDNAKIYKDYKNLFEKIKKCAKKNYYRNKIKLFENDIRGTWKIMKEIIGKKKCNSLILPKQILVDKIEVNDARSIAEKFNEFYVNAGPNLAKKIPQSVINKIFNIQSPTYLLNVIPVSSRSYFTRYAENVPSFKVRHDFFKNSFFPSTAIEWNKIDKNIRKLESLNIFKKKKNLKFIRPSQNRVYNCHNPKGIKLLTRLRVGLSHLREHKFKHSFQDTLNPICTCGEDIETTSHYLLHCPDYLEERKTLLNTISCIVPNIFDFNNDQLTEILLYGKDDLDNINNTSILDGTINYLIETKRFNAQLF